MQRTFLTYKKLEVDKLSKFYYKLIATKKNHVFAQLCIKEEISIRLNDLCNKKLAILKLVLIPRASL